MNAFDDMGRPQDGGILDVIPLGRKSQDLDDRRPVPAMTTVGDYQPYRCVRALLQERYRALPKRPTGTPTDTDIWMQTLGRRNKAKFLRRMHEWVTLKKAMPLPFLEILGISLQELTDAFGHDLRAYRDALRLAVRPECLQTRYGPCVYPVFRIPESVANEEEAIAYTREFIIRYGRRDACLQYRHLKTVWVTREGHYTEYYEPKMVVGKDSVLFVLPAMHGTVSL